MCQALGEVSTFTWIIAFHTWGRFYFFTHFTVKEIEVGWRAQEAEECPEWAPETLREDTPPSARGFMCTVSSDPCNHPVRMEL